MSMNKIEWLTKELMENVRTEKQAKVLEGRTCNNCHRNCNHCAVDDMIKFHLEHVVPELTKSGK